MDAFCLNVQRAVARAGQRNGRKYIYTNCKYGEQHRNAAQHVTAGEMPK